MLFLLELPCALAPPHRTEGTPFVSPDDVDPPFWTRFVRIEPFRRGDGHAEGVRSRVPPAAVALARSGRPVGQLAVDLQVSDATLFRWVAQVQVDRGERPGLPTVERVELAQARKRIRDLEIELEISKKASALFAEGEVRPKGSSR